MAGSKCGVQKKDSARASVGKVIFTVFVAGAFAGGAAVAVQADAAVVGEDAAVEAQAVQIDDDQYPELLEGALTKEQFEIALAYAPEKVENGEISSNDLLTAVEEISYDFADVCFNGTYTEPSLNAQGYSDFGYYTYSLDDVNRFLSVLTDRPLSESDMQQWAYPDALSISGDSVRVTIYDGEWMTPHAGITDAVLSDGAIMVTYNVRATGSGVYYPESTGTRTAILKQAQDGRYRVETIFPGTVENPYEDERQKLLATVDDSGYETVDMYYDLVTLEETDEAHRAVNTALNADYQAYFAYNERLTGYTYEEILASGMTTPYDVVGAGVTNIENGVLSVRFTHTVMGSVNGAWQYGLTYSLETGEALRVTDLTDLGDEELLALIRSALQDYIFEVNYQNTNELLSKVDTYTLDDIGSGFDFRDTCRLSFFVDAGEIFILVPPGEFFSDIWSNQAIPTGIYITGAETAAVSSASDGDYIFPDSSTSYLTRDDLTGLTDEELRIARNELYARHGRKFSDESLNAYFNSKSWYNGTIEPEDFDERMLNTYEVANRDLILDYEAERESGGAGESAAAADTADTVVIGSVQEIYEQVLRDVNSGKYLFQYSFGTIRGYQYFLTDMNGDGIPELVVAQIYNSGSDAGVGVFDWLDTRVFTAEPDAESFRLVTVSGELDILAAFYAGDGNGFYIETDLGRGTGNVECHRVTLASDTLSVGSAEGYSLADDSMDRFTETNPSVTWYDITDLTGLAGNS